MARILPALPERPYIHFTYSCTSERDFGLPAPLKNTQDNGKDRTRSCGEDYGGQGGQSGLEHSLPVTQVVEMDRRVSQRRYGFYFPVRLVRS